MKKHSFLLLLIFTSLLSYQTNLYCQWVQSNGPNGAIITSFAVSGTNIFAGTQSGGIYLSTNNGTNWVNTGFTNTPNLIQSIIVKDANLFAGTGGQGIFLSTNNGVNWSAVNSGLANLNIYSLAASGANLFAGSEGGSVFLSTNNGTNWTRVNIGLTTANVRTIVVSGTNLFAGTDGGGVFLSTNNGANWAEVNSGLTSTTVFTLAASNANLFAGTNNGVFLSTNNGTSWTAVNSGLTITFTYTLAISGDNLFAGTFGGGVFLSTNNGASWTAVNSGLTNFTISALIVSGTNLFAGTYGGSVFISSDNGDSWTSINSGLINTTVNALATTNVNLFAGTNGGAFLSTNNGTSWTTVNSGLTNTIVSALTVSGTNLFAGTNGGVFLSTNNGASWSAVNNGLANLHVKNIKFSGSNIFAGTSDGVFLSTNNCTSWTAVNSGLTNTNVNAFAVSDTNLFAGTDGGVFHSTNNGTSWAAVNSGLPNTTVFALAVSGANIFAAIADNGVFLSTNNGESWTAVNNGLPSYPIDVVTFAISGVNLFVGTDFFGIFLSTNNGTSWTAVNTGLPANIQVWSFALSDTYIFAGICGKGVWCRKLSEFNLPSITLAVTLPNGGESWKAASVHAITWTSSNVTNVKLEYTTDSGTNWTTIIESTAAAAGNYNWTVPNVSSTQCKVRITDVSTANISDISDNTFTIYQPIIPIAVTLPNGGEKWKAASIHAITWISNNVTNVKLEYTTDSGTNWATIIESTAAAAGSYNWTIPNVSSTQCKVRVTDVSAADINDISDNTFTIYQSTTIYNGSVLFDGADISNPDLSMYVKDGAAANPNAFKINGKAISVEAWVYPVDLPNPQNGNTIVARTLNTANVEPWISYRLWINHSNGVSLPAFSISSGLGGSTVTVQSPDDISSFQWAHLAGTYDGTVLKIYVNGTLKAQVNTSISINSANGVGLYIGRFKLDTFQGAIDEVRLWNIARSQSDIQSSMQTQLVGDEAGLAGYWNMDTTALTPNKKMQDQTANHNDLQFGGYLLDRIIPFNPSTPLNIPLLSVDPGSLDFGTIEQGSPSFKRGEKLTNNGTGPLLGIFPHNISNISPVNIASWDWMFFLLPGQSLTDSLSLQPLVSGRVSGSIQIHSNAPAVEIPFTIISLALKKIDVNNISMYVQQDGQFAHNLINNNPGFEWQKGSGKNAVYESGIWIAAHVNSQLKTATASYWSEFQAGPILSVGGVAASSNDTTYRVYKISVGDNSSTNADYAQWPAALGAPVNSDGTPKFIGDQTLFSVYNDLDPSRHHFGTSPLGAEIQQTTFAFKNTGTLSNTVFLNFKIINKSNSTWKDTYVSLWSDPDLGDPFDDLVGIDVPRNLGYDYNGLAADAVYGDSPPALGYKILKGAFFTKPIQGFSYYTGTGSVYPYIDPQSASQVYNFMQGLWADGTSYVDPTTSLKTTFALNGDPVTGIGWRDGSPGDRRFLFTTGPFDLDPGQAKEFVAAIIVGQGESNINSITALRSASDEIQALYDSGQIFGGALVNVQQSSATNGNSNTINDIANSGSQITFTGGTGGVVVESASYIQAPPGAASITTSSVGGIGKYLDVQVQGTVTWPMQIRIYYTKNDLLQAGIVEDDIQGLYYWSGLANAWKLYSNSGADDQGRGISTTFVNTTNVTINSVNYEGYVEAQAYHLTPMVVGAKKTATNITNNSEIPTKFVLSQNYPDPFNPTTIISYQIPKTAHVVLKVYDILGREIETLVNEEKAPGIYKVNFNAGSLSSGVYIYRITAGDYVSSKKMLLIK